MRRRIPRNQSPLQSPIEHALCRLCGFAAMLAIVCCCSSSGQGSLRPNTDPVVSPTALLLNYSVTVSKEMDRLSVTAVFPPGTPRDWAVFNTAMPFVEGLQIFAQGKPSLNQQEGERACEKSGCTLKYEFALAEAARQISSRVTAATWQHAIVAPSSTWLLRPREAPLKSRYRFTVNTPPGLGFASGVFRSPHNPNAYEAALPAGFNAPYAAFGKMHSQTLHLGNSALHVHFLSPQPSGHQRQFLDWIKSSADAISAYYGGYPAPSTDIFIRPLPYHGSQMGIGGSSIILGMDSRASHTDPNRSWVAAHEMVHVGFPDVARRHSWATEGLATYVESVARAQQKLTTRERLWSTFLANMHLGVPRIEDNGLDRTRTWASTYWGGALFWFLADLEIQRKSNLRKSLKDALQGIVLRGGNTNEHWTIDRVMTQGDLALGIRVLMPLYLRHANHPEPTDLTAIWQSLGVSRKNGSVHLAESAPEAPLRRRIEGG